MASKSFVIGGAALMRKLAKAQSVGPTAVASAAWESMAEMMADSKEHYVPVDVGTLKGSGTVLPPDITASQIEIIAGYGGAAKAYALEQHENLEYEHRVGQAKYLERPFLEHEPRMKKNMTTALRAALTRLGG